MKNELAKISNLHEDREKALKTKLASVEEQLQKVSVLLACLHFLFVHVCRSVYRTGNAYNFGR